MAFDSCRNDLAYKKLYKLQRKFYRFVASATTCRLMNNKRKYYAASEFFFQTKRMGKKRGNAVRRTDFRERD